MSRLYPDKAKRGWWRKHSRPYEITTDGGIRVRDIEREPEKSDLAKPTPVEAQHAGWVLRGGVYVWGGRGVRRKA